MRPEHCKWMNKAGTSKPLMTITNHTHSNAERMLAQSRRIRIRMELFRGWRPSCLTQALTEQQQIRWHNFFKGRISQTWTDIQQREYSRQSQHRIDTNEEPVPKHYSGTWWAANLIKQVVFMSLTLWQIRNDALHADQIMTDYNTQRRLLQTQKEEGRYETLVFLLRIDNDR